MDRRRFLLTSLAGALAAPLGAAAEQPPKNVRIGVLSQGSQDPARRLPLIEPLRALGWVENQNVVFEYRFADGRNDRLPTLAAELVDRKVDLIFSRGTPATLAAKAATNSIPIVMINVLEPVRSSLISSLARPGGNVTGLAGLGVDLFGKQLQLIKEIVPRAAIVAVLYDPLNPAQIDQLQNELPAAAKALALKLHLVKVDASSVLERTVSEAQANRADALLVLPLSSGTRINRKLADLAIKHRLPTVTTFSADIRQGMLLSFSASIEEGYRRAAVYIDKILRGARPADLPVEQSTRFELVVNLKTAKALGLTIPPSLLLRADQIIE